MESMQCAAKIACDIRPMEALKPALIVFDLDGTLTDSRMLARESYRRVFALLGYGEISQELADSFNGPSADEICQRMGIGPDRRALYDELIDASDEELVASVGRLFPGIEEMLAQLAPHACLAILTNGSKRYCQANIDHFGLAPYISLYSGFVSGVSKAQRIQQWRQQLGSECVIVVGDRRTDMENARRASAYAIGVTYGMGGCEELAQADCLCDTPEQVCSACLAHIAGM